MAYNAVSQRDHDVASNDSVSDRSDSPQQSANHQHTFQSVSSDFENLGGSNYRNAAKMTNESSSVSLTSMIRGLGPASTSYDILEDADYKSADPIDNAQQASKHSHAPSASNKSDHRRPDYGRTTSVSPEPIIRSPSNSRPPLRHPTPDLQSLQGAYVGNVERLEKSVEHLSLKSDIGEELRKMELQRRLSSGSAYTSAGGQVSTDSNSASIPNSTFRTGGYSQGGFVTSPRGSLRSASSQAASRARSGSVASRLASVLEPENEDQHTHIEPPSIPMLPPPQPLETLLDQGFSQHLAEEHEYTLPEDVPQRPGTAESSDTYRQATNLFRDFDGVHFTPHNGHERPRGVSLNKPPLARESRHFERPAPGQEMVFYPAPVPMVLNLPEKLSRKPNPDVEKRRSQLLSSMPMENRKSAAWLPIPEDGDPAAARRSKILSNAPPQLRASAFFDQPSSAPINVGIKHNSAVETLDSILDASANAPVSAFTDHPIAGHVGSEVYGKKKKITKVKQKRDSTNPFGAEDSATASRSQTQLVSSDKTELNAADASDEVAPLRISFGEHRESLDLDTFGQEHGRKDRSSQKDDQSESASDEEEVTVEEEEEDVYTGPPTTLLAELQMRKQEQKQRTRTAATAFPNGMHSTLLELEAVAQHQSKTRNQRRVALAWEDPVIAEREEPNDEDVPLAVLYPGKNALADENRPMGLMEQMQLEENEPLSRRRARIRGEPVRNSTLNPLRRVSAANPVDAQGSTEADPEEKEGETLGQRARRLREEAAAASSAEFANDLISQFGPEPTTKPEEPKPVPQSGPEEETLGQRRKRLQAESQAQVGTGKSAHVKQRRSMADILQAHPVRHGVPNMAHPNVAQHPHATRPFQPSTFGNRMSTATMQPPLMGQNFGQLPMGMPGYPSAVPAPYGNAPYFNMPTNGMGMNYSTPGLSQQDAQIDPKQRAMIDRWRQSVMH